MNLKYRIPAIFFFTLISLISLGQSSKNKITIPNLIGMTLTEARKVLSKTNLSIGAIVASDKINLDAEADSLIVYHQVPDSKIKTKSSNWLNKNKLIDIWVTKNNNSGSLNKSKQQNQNITNDFR